MATTEENPNQQVLINTDANPDTTRMNRFRSSFLNLFPVTTSLPHDRQALRQAFINLAAILFFFVCGACASLAYKILEPFIRSLLWSILAGAFLFPLKKRLKVIGCDALNQLETNSHLLFYGLVILLPLKIICGTIESIFPFCLQKWKQVLTMILFLLTIRYIERGIIYNWITTIGYDFLQTFVYLVHLFDSLWVTTLVIAYLIAVLTIYDNSPWTKTILNLFAIPVWFILLAYLSQFLPVNYRLIVIILSIILIVVGFIVDLREHIQQNPIQPNDNQHRISVFTHLTNIFNHLGTYNSPTSIQSTLPAASSTPYFSFILWSLVAIKIYQFSRYVFQIIGFIIIYTIIKYLLIKFYNYLIQQETVVNIKEKVFQYLINRRDVLIPSPLYGLIKFLIKGDKKFNQGLKESMDYLVSAFMIVTLLTTVLFGSILLIIQIQHESSHMINLTKNIVNETTVLQPSFQYMLPDKEYMTKLMDTAVDNFYSIGKTWIIKQVNDLSQDRISNGTLEKDVLQLWDHLFNYMSNISNLIIPDNNRSITMYSSVNYTDTLSDFVFQYNDIYNLIRNNIGIVRTVMDSILTNTTLLLTLLSTMISLLFTGGFALFNFFVSFIVFVTLLFYLLSNSDKPIYPPTEWLNNTLAIGGRGLGKAVHDSVTSVFVASLKIAIFYGLYTYVLHTIVGSNLVFLPAVIASICAVTLKSYWAALPGCLDLWLVQQRPLGAFILLLGQIAPVYVVDTAIYSEVKGGGHQYLTALAIAGGVYYRGIEGALIGPIVLCCLLVGMKLYNETMATTLSSTNSLTPTIRPRLRSRSVPIQVHVGRYVPPVLRN